MIYHKAISEIEEKVDKLMLGWHSLINLSAIQDDLTEQAPGWSFLAHEQNKLRFEYKVLARRAWESSLFGKPFAKAGRWLPEACSAYLSTAHR